MFNGKTVSFQTVLWRVMNQSFMSDISEEQAADYAYDLIRRIKMGFLLNAKPETVEINNYKAVIPEDLVTLRGMRYKSSKEDRSYQSVRYNGNIYSSGYHCEEYGQDEGSDLLYTLNDNYIDINTKTGFLELSYYGMLLDEDGYPKIPDDQSFKDALYYYIIKEHLFGLLAIGKVSERFYSKVEQEYAWAIGQATNSLKLAGMDHWDTTMKGINRMIHDQSMAAGGFKGLHQQEKIRKRFNSDSGINHSR
mgnify:FL=1|tara:strand:+ start:36231 stop:36980 length:750 start_codon:yes stop_codon:yes gene_type:complete